MVARKILKWPNPKLIKKSLDIEIFDEKISFLAKDLRDTMKVNYGIGLAATQIGDPRSACIISGSYVPTLPVDIFDPSCVFLGNPQLEYLSDRTFSWPEACLSVDDITATVRRYGTIRLTYRNTAGDKVCKVLEGPESAIVQHETDHLVGKLFIHRLEGITRHSVHKKLRKRSLKLRAQSRAQKARAKKPKKRKKR